MNKRFYSDYVRNALRFYSRNLDIKVFNCIASKRNWNACNNVLNLHFPLYKEVLISVYKGYDTMGDNVYETAKKYNIPQDKIWAMMERLERLIAVERGWI